MNYLFTTVPLLTFCTSGFTLSALLARANLWKTSASRSQSSERLSGVLFHFAGPFLDLLQPGTSLVEGCERSPEELPSALVHSLAPDLQLGPRTHRGKSLSERLPCLSVRHMYLCVW